MSIKLKRIVSLGVVLAPWLLAMPASGAPDEVFSVTSTINVPNISPNTAGLASFDIAFVDPVAGVLLLADRSNKSIDVVDTSTNNLISQLQPGSPGFAGSIPVASCPTVVTPKNCSGPNGVLSFTQGKNKKQQTEVWVGDGFSRVWVLDLKTGASITPSPISTAITSGDPNRADELCYDPNDGIVLVANPNSPTPFVTFISTEDHSILGKIAMNGELGQNDPTGVNIHGGKLPPIAANGIEQCQYSPRTGTFYLNVPQATIPSSSPTTNQDLVLQIDPVSMAILNIVNLTATPSTGCVVTTGMALGPNHQLAISCGNSGSSSVIISEDFSDNTTPFAVPLLNVTGADEIWYNPGDNHYFYATVFQPATGITLNTVDACGENPSPCVPIVDAAAKPPTAIGNKAAADPIANQVYVPVNPGNASSSKICGNPVPSPNLGCIAVFTTTNDDQGICSKDFKKDKDDQNAFDCKAINKAAK